MKRAFYFNFYVLRYNEYFYLIFAMLLIYLIFSFAVGVNMHFEHSELTDADLADYVFHSVSLCASMGIILVTLAFYMLPMLETDIEGRKRSSMARLAASLPVKRYDLAVSRMVCAGISSIILILLAAAAVLAGLIYDGGVGRSIVCTIMESWLVMIVPVINIAGVLTTALYLACRQFMIPVFAGLSIVYLVIKLITPGFLFGSLSSRMFWPVFIALVLLTDVLIGYIGVRAYLKRDI